MCLVTIVRAKMAIEPAETPMPDNMAPIPASPPVAIELLTTEFKPLYALVYRYLCHRFFDSELAEEFTAQTFYNAARWMRRIDPDIRVLRVWLLRTATNLANTHYRRRRVRDAFLRTIGSSQPTQTAPDSSQDAETGPQPLHVRAALQALRPKYQTVVVLRYYTELSFADIGAIVGCREDAVRARLSRAVRELRQCLSADGQLGSRPASQTEA